MNIKYCKYLQKSAVKHLNKISCIGTFVSSSPTE